MIVAFEPQEFTPAGMGTGQAQSEHSRFTARVGEAHDFGGWHHAAKAFCSLHFRGGREGEVGAFRHRRGDCNMGLPMSLPNFELILMGVQGYSSNQVSGMGVLGLDGTSLSAAFNNLRSFIAALVCGATAAPALFFQTLVSSARWTMV